jgi:hypothetical protein
MIKKLLTLHLKYNIFRDKCEEDPSSPAGKKKKVIHRAT